jgi:hypothetical protein
MGELSHDDNCACGGGAISGHASGCPERATAPSNPAEVGDFILVPREPTGGMLKAGMDDLGWWCEPYEAPRESGVSVDTDMSAEEATRINSMQIEVIASAFRAMLAAAPSPPIGDTGGVGEDGARALCLLKAEDDRNDKIHELLETIREQIRVDLAPEHRPEGLMTNIQNAVYAMRGRIRLMDDIAITAPLAALVPARVEAVEPRVKNLEWTFEGGAFMAETVVGNYYIQRRDGDWLCLRDGLSLGYFDDGSIDPVKAAAQADYEARILAALQANPS